MRSVLGWMRATMRYHRLEDVARPSSSRRMRPTRTSPPNHPRIVDMRRWLRWMRYNIGYRWMQPVQTVGTAGSSFCLMSCYPDLSYSRRLRRTFASYVLRDNEPVHDKMCNWEPLFHMVLTGELWFPIAQISVNGLGLGIILGLLPRWVNHFSSESH